MTGCYRFALELTRLVAMICFNVRYIGRENLPRTGGYVLACNHRHFIDPVILAHGVPRQVYYMAKAELFKIPILGSILRWVHVFPVERGTGDMSAVEKAIDNLREGGLLGIFPEGTRSLDDNLLRFKSGMAHIAKSAEVGVVPCSLKYIGKLGFRTRIEVTFGKPISFDELFGEEQQGAALKRATKLVRGRISGLLGLEELAP